MTLLDLLQKNHVPYALGGTHRHVRHGWVGL